MGGAGSLRTAAGVDLVDTPGFPEVAKPESLGFRAALHELLEGTPRPAWTGRCSRRRPLSRWPPRAPAGTAPPMTRCSTDENGASRISAADLAAALVDELENPKHPRARFTTAY